MESSPVYVRRAPGYLGVAITRPDAHNAISFEVMTALETVLDEAEASPLRVFELFSTAEKVMISGGDLKSFHQLVTEDEGRAMAARMCAILHRIEQLNCISVASISADLYGGGWEICSAFDLRIIKEGVRVAFSQGRFNLTPGWGGFTRLSELVGSAQAVQLLALQSKLNAQELLQLGFAQKVLPQTSYEADCAEYLHTLLSNDVSLNLALKKLHHSVLCKKSRKELFEAELELFGKLWVHPEHERRVETFLKGK